TLLHFRHRGRIPPRRSENPRLRSGADGADAGRRGGTWRAGGTGAPSLANRGRDQRPPGLLSGSPPPGPTTRAHRQGRRSYRLAVFHELPRTGLPQRFASFGEYQRTVDVLVRNKVIDDSTKIWWDMRPSGKFPTLEMRVTDVCTRLDDAVSIAALYVCIMR